MRHRERLVHEEFDLPIRIAEIPILREAFEKGQAEGLDKGIAKGIEQGVQLGARREAIGMLEHFLIQRFGTLPEWVKPRIEASDLPQIHTWVDRAVTGASVDDVFRE